MSRVPRLRLRPAQSEEFAALDEDDQYTYLEELAGKLTKMHLQFLQGVMHFDDDDDEAPGGDDDDDE